MILADFARDGPIFFNKATGRFGPPDSTSFGTCYFGMNAGCAFLEGLMDHVVDGTSGTVVSMSLMHQRCICTVSSTRALRLVDLTNGRSLKSIHAQLDSRIADCPHNTSQAWADAFWRHPDEPDGIVYRARNAPDRYAVALFDRVEADLVANNCESNLLDDRLFLGSLLDELNMGLIP